MARVLLVDDDGGVLETCGSILRHAGLDSSEVIATRQGAVPPAREGTVLALASCTSDKVGER